MASIVLKLFERISYIFSVPLLDVASRRLRRDCIDLAPAPRAAGRQQHG
ncbi:hypothetical protein G3N58_19385 [Paraburkholderia sp. Ac-20342]|nr:hypothetical protein [Paraburkholderia sp. Ac-20342]